MLLGLAVTWLSLLLPTRPHAPLRAPPPALCSPRVRVSELRRELERRGVSTADVFELEELLRLLDEDDQQRSVDQQRCARPSPRPPRRAGDERDVSELSIVEVLRELQQRGVSHDVLAPDAALVELLRSTRGGAPAAARPPRGPPPRRPPTGRAPPGSPLEEVADGLASAVDWLVPRAVEPLVGIAKAGVEVVASGEAYERAAAVSATPRAKAAAVTRRVRRAVQLPPKPVLLGLCVCALKFGPVRTALVAACLKLSVELVHEGLAWRGWRKRAA